MNPTLKSLVRENDKQYKKSLSVRKLDSWYFHEWQRFRAANVASRSIWFGFVENHSNFVLLYLLTWFSNYACIHKIWKWISWKFPNSYQSTSLQFVCRGKLKVYALRPSRGIHLFCWDLKLNYRIRELKAALLLQRTISWFTVSFREKILTLPKSCGY